MRRSSGMLLLGVCLFSGSQWLLPWNEPSPVTELVSLATGATLSALALGLWLQTRGQALRFPDLWSRNLVLSGIGAIGLPAVLLLTGRQQFSSVMAVATQASLPVIVAIASAAIDPGSELQLRLMPALLALAGALLVLPVALPHTPQGWFGFLLYLAAACLSGVSSVFCHREMVRKSRGSLFVVIVANAGFLSITALVLIAATERGHIVGGLPVRQIFAPIAATAMSLLAVGVLLRMLSPMAAASRLIFSPLIATLEAFTLLHPTLSPRIAIGAALMFLGGLACLDPDRGQVPPRHMSLR